MNSVLIATLGGVSTAAAWGTTDWLTSKITHKQSAWTINFMVQVIGIVMIGLVLVLNPATLPTAIQWLRLSLGVIIINCGYLTFLKALKGGAVGIIVPLNNIYPLFTLILSIIFLGQIFKQGQVAAMLVIVAGAAFLAYEKNHQNIPLRELHHKSILATWSAVIIGFGFFILNPLFHQLSWQVLLFCESVAATIFAALTMLAVYRRSAAKTIVAGYKDKTLWTISVVGNLGAIGLYIGAGAAHSIVIPTVVAGAAPLVSAGLAAVYDKEKLGMLKRLGAVGVVGGVILLNAIK
jgi:drug/metabolite transporter (DMT)-like permease